MVLGVWHCLRFVLDWWWFWMVGSEVYRCCQFGWFVSLGVCAGS